MDEFLYLRTESAPEDSVFTFESELPHDSPAALKARLRESELVLQEAQRRKSLVEDELKRLESVFRADCESYVRALEATVAEDRLQASVPLTRGSAEDEILDVDVRILLKRMNSDAKRERAGAEKQFKSLGIRVVGPLLRLMEKEARRRDKWSMAVAGVSVFAIMVSLLGIATEVNRSSEPLYLFLLLVLVALVNTTRPTRTQKRAAQELARFDDARVLGPLAQGLELDDHYTRTVAAEGLKRLLPRVRASDAGLVSKEELHRLYRTLDSEDLELVLRILQGLEQIGDEDAIPYVEKLRSLPAFTSQEHRVRGAAADCITTLKARLGREAVGSTLLRAARSPKSGEGNLLRPAAESAPSNSEMLLRPLPAESEVL